MFVFFLTYVLLGELSRNYVRRCTKLTYHNVRGSCTTLLYIHDTYSLFYCCYICCNIYDTFGIATKSVNNNSFLEFKWHKKNQTRFISIYISNSPPSFAVIYIIMYYFYKLYYKQFSVYLYILFINII